MLSLYPYLIFLFDVVFFGAFRKILFSILGMLQLQSVYTYLQFKLMLILKYILGFRWLPMVRIWFKNFFQMILGKNFYADFISVINNFFSLPIFDFIIYYFIRISVMDYVVNNLTESADKTNKTSHRKRDISDQWDESEISSSDHRKKHHKLSISDKLDKLDKLDISERETNAIHRFVENESVLSPIETFNENEPKKIHVRK